MGNRELNDFHTEGDIDTELGVVKAFCQWGSINYIGDTPTKK